MEKKLYFECYSGISGDMTVAALLDLGADEKVLRNVLSSLSVKDFEVKVSRVMKSGIDACDFDVVLNVPNHDHDMEYLYGIKNEEHYHHHHEGGHHEHEHHEHHYEGEYHEHEHHEHHHGGEHQHHHEHRGMKEITEIIESASMSEGAKKLALKIFDVLAHAEAKAHNRAVEDVHFHEVGAVDSIVDIISVAVCLDDLGIKSVVVPSLYEGKGTVRCQHGILPVPVPAVANIVQAHSIKMQIKEMDGEYITPTGAAIVAATKTEDVLPEHFVIEKIGIGAGKRKYDGPGILRVMIIEG